jgi:hypothetical protein
MVGAEFKQWMARCGLSNREASALLGFSRRTVIRYANGWSAIPKHVDLACANIEDKQMAYSKDVNMHKRRAMGETITGMKKGGAAECKPMKRGGAVKKGNPFAKKGSKEC